MTAHTSRCCDVKKKERAKKSLSVSLPGIEGKTAHKSNRFINPNSNKSGEAKTFFPVMQGIDIPVLDGCGNLLGLLSGSAKQKGVRINWGQIKTMPRFDLSKLTPDWMSRAAQTGNQGVQYVYAFNTSMVTPAAWRGKPPYTAPFDISKGIPVSAWIPKSALRPSTKRTKLLECAKGCMDSIQKYREKSGATRERTIANLDKVRWSSREWSRAWRASDNTDATMTNEAVKSLLQGRDSVTYKRFFPNASISNAKGGEGNMAVRDYLARSPALPPQVRCVNLLWAVPGSGGVSIDSLPVGTKFYRLVAYKKQTRIYKRGKPTAKKITWWYGFVRYPIGDGKTDRRYGWILKNALST